VDPVTTTSEATNAVTLPQQIIIDAETEDPPALDMSPAEPTMSTAASVSSASPGATTSPKSQSIEAAPAVTARVQAPAAAPSADAKATAARPARPGSSAVWARGIGKAGLLSAIRASRPAHAGARKTL
jgi:hypothetical protein